MVAKAKRKIMETAETLFVRQGYHGTGTNAIIDGAGVSRGSFFYHFPDKSALIQEVLRRYVDKDLVHPLTDAFTKHSNPVQALRHYVDQLESWHRRSGFTGGCLLGNIALELSDSHDEVRELMSDCFEQWRRILRKHLATNDLKMDLEQFITLYISVIQGVTMTTRVYKDRALATQEFTACRTLIDMAFGAGH